MTSRSSLDEFDTPWLDLAHNRRVGALSTVLSDR